MVANSILVNPERRVQLALPYGPRICCHRCQYESAASNNENAVKAIGQTEKGNNSGAV